MILDVQPLVKSLFCPIRPPPNGLFDSEASIPENWISLFGGGGWGGVKSFRSEGSKQWGRLWLSNNRRSNGNADNVNVLVGGSNPGWMTFGGGGGGGGVITRPGFEPPTKKTPVSCITIRPLFGLRRKVSPLLGAAFASDRNPNYVFLSD